jgi:hypothetical protein
MNFEDKLINVLLEVKNSDLYSARTDTGSPDYDPYAGPLARRAGKSRSVKSAPKSTRKPVSTGLRLMKNKLNSMYPGLGDKVKPMNMHAYEVARRAQSKKMRAKGSGLGSATKTVKGQAAAEQQSDYKKMRGDR